MVLAAMHLLKNSDFMQVARKQSLEKVTDFSWVLRALFSNLWHHSISKIITYQKVLEHLPMLGAYNRNYLELTKRKIVKFLERSGKRIFWKQNDFRDCSYNQVTNQTLLTWKKILIFCLGKLKTLFFNFISLDCTC